MVNLFFTATLIFSLLGAPFLAQPAAPGSGYQPGACPFTVPASLTEGADVNCGTLTVPANHDQPDGPQIKLAVAVFKHQGTLSRVEPLFILQGGPGGSTLDVHPSLVLGSPLLQHFDIVMLEQRGTHYSQPNLSCSEADQYILDTLNVDIAPAESNKQWVAAVLKCHDRLAGQGIDLSDFDSIQNARDVDALRLALGYDKINLYGVSYGTLLALHYMRLFPDSLRAVVLDGVVPPQVNYLTTNVLDQDRVFKAFFKACQDSPSCSTAYPDLEKVFFQVIDDLDKNPAHVVLIDQSNGKSYPALLNGESFYSGVYEAFYSVDFIPALPRAIYRARERDFDGFTALLSFFTFDHSVSYGMYYSVNCAEHEADAPQTLDLSKVLPKIAEFDQGSEAAFQTICKGWAVAPLDPAADLPVKSDLPVLLLSGGLDPVTPPDNAASVAATLPHSFSYTVPSSGHGQAFANKCVDGLIQAFLEQPAVEPNSSCLADYAAVKFWSPNAVVPLPLFGRVLNLDRSLLWPMGALGLFMLGLLSTLLLIPLVWLVKLFLPKRKPAVPAPAGLAGLSGLAEPQPAFGSGPAARLALRFAGFAAMLNSLLLPAFWAALTIALVQMSLARDMMVAWGVSSAWRPLFLLPLLFLALTLLMVWECFLGWLSTGWSIWRKLYYSLMVLCALACVGLMIYLGAMFQVFG